MAMFALHTAMSRTRTALAALLCLAVCGCQGPGPDVGGATVRAEATLATAGFAILIQPALRGDIDHVDFQLVTSAGLTPVGTAFSVTQAMNGGPFGGTVTVQFAKVPNGTYKLRAEAFDAGNGSLTQASAGTLGPVVSSSMVTVNALSVTPVSGSLSVTVPLRDGTGESVRSSIVITEDITYPGQPDGAPI
ncbi:MAG: hypothetical protein H7338_20235 [Candidatus Sericytochromatia bacterium]|nr:hypothetical protein [Candidatus Sericytochromatia bacterium]